MMLNQLLKNSYTFNFFNQFLKSHLLKKTPKLFYRKDI